MIELRVTSVAALTAAALILAPANASAQFNRATIHHSNTVDFAVQAGAALPADHLQDFTNIGLNVGADAAWHLTDRFAVRIDGDYDGLPGEKNVPIAPSHGTSGHAPVPRGRRARVRSRVRARRSPRIRGS